MGLRKSLGGNCAQGDAMKSHYTVEHFFHERFRAQLGVILALLRVAFAYALTNVALSLHAAMPEALASLKVQVVPFLEALATAWSFSSWRAGVIVAGVALGAGLFTRTAGSIFLLFFTGAVVIDRTAFLETMEPWTSVTMTLLAVVLLSRWGRVFGLDEIIERAGIFTKKRTRSGRSIF